MEQIVKTIDEPKVEKKVSNKTIVRQKIIKKTILWTLLAAICTLFFSIVVDSFSSGHRLSNSTLLESVEAVGEYGEYLSQYPEVYPENVDIVIPGTDAVETEFAITDDYVNTYGMNALETIGQGSATWRFNITEAGFYNIKLDYIPEKDGGANIERRIYINDEVVFEKLNNVAFHRIWGDAHEKIVDVNGNEIRSLQVELPERQQAYIRDQIGYITEPYLIYFEAGENEITIESLRESMSIFNVHITSREYYRPYAEVLAEYENLGYKKIDGQVTGYFEDENSPIIEGEDAVKRSSPTIYPISDRSSLYNSPSDPVKIILNAIGGAKWSTPGESITWEVNVPEAGLYNISLRAKQSTSRGLFSTRKVFINDEIPFAEAQNLKFVYDSEWSIVTLGSEEEPFYFYLEEGKNEITFEVTLGDYGSQINRVQNVIDDISAMYRSIISKIGITPDPYIDYRLPEQIPNLIETFGQSADILEDVSRTITEISGEKSSETAVLDSMALQLRQFIDNYRLIQIHLNRFSQNISALGTWILNVSNQALTVDYLIVHSEDYKLPKANPNFFKSTWFQIQSFVESFFFDYSSIGTTEHNEDYPTIEVWLLTSPTIGREQANSMRLLIDSTFKENINVDLKIVPPNVLLRAIVAGIGPDVAINAENGLPVNYALRNAIYDLSQFEDFDEVKSWFYPSAMVPYEYEGGYYALPHIQTFLVTFYREDIFEDQGWEVPETWTDVINLIPELQIQNLRFYLPLNVLGAVSIVNQIFASRLFQTGGELYRTSINDQGQEYLETNFDSEEAMAAFEFWAEFYTSYSFSLTIDAATFINRFRTGEMPIGIANYNIYNFLMVSAPEIRGKWAFELLPGTLKEDGTIDRSGAASGFALVMNKQTQKPNEAWEFMKWWVSEETQVSFNREIEAIIGTAARHPTPNIEAFNRIPWTVEELDILAEQFQYTVGIPEVAGGYYTGRNLENAFREVVNNNLNPRDTLEQYVLSIDREIARKRKEFGLPVASD